MAHRSLCGLLIDIQDAHSHKAFATNDISKGELRSFCGAYVASKGSWLEWSLVAPSFRSFSLYLTFTSHHGIDRHSDNLDLSSPKGMYRADKNKGVGRRA